MLERFKELFSTIKDTTEAWIEKAKSSGLFHKSLLGVAGFIAVSVLLIVVCKVMGVLLDSVYNFVERHFFAIAASCSGGSYLVYRHNEKKAEQAQVQRERTQANDMQKERFAKGAYRIIGKFVFTEIANAPNFKELCSCERPIRVEEMGTPNMDSFVRNSIIYLRYALPKVCVEPVEVNMVKSVFQGLVDQKIRTRGIPPLISVGDNEHLYLDTVEDMRTYLLITFALDFSDSYIQQIAYDHAMTEILGKSDGNVTFNDPDYGE